MFCASSNNHRSILGSGYCVKEFGNLLDRAQVNQYGIGLRVILQMVAFHPFPVVMEHVRVS